MEQLEFYMYYYFNHIQFTPPETWLIYIESVQYILTDSRSEMQAFIVPRYCFVHFSQKLNLA